LNKPGGVFLVHDIADIRSYQQDQEHHERGALMFSILNVVVSGSPFL